MIKWKKPNGTELETNDDKGNVEFAELNGWVRVEKAPVTKKTVKTAKKTK